MVLNHSKSTFKGLKTRTLVVESHKNDIIKPKGPLYRRLAQPPSAAVARYPAGVAPRAARSSAALSANVGENIDIARAESPAGLQSK